MLEQAGQRLIALTPVGPHGLSPEEEAHIEAISQQLRDEDPPLAQPEPFVSEHLARHMPRAAPRRILLDDFSVISHIQRVLGLEFYTSRAFVRADDDDLILGTFDPIEGYVEYLDGHLGMGRATYLPVPKIPQALPYAVCDAALAQEPVLEQIAAALEAQNEAGEVWLHPYMGHRPLWQLAEALQARMSRQLRVVAPPPVLCDRANNKAWFMDVVRRILGPDFTPPNRVGHDASEVASALLQLLDAAASVSVKLADSASGMGTGIFSREELRPRSLQDLTPQMEAWLEQKDWLYGSSPPVVIEPWYHDVLGSPSVQLWIPPLEVGAPMVEGIYDQLFYPDEAHVFLGSIPSQLPAALQQQLAHTGAQVGRVFQKLGYLGRCSFDTILTGPHLDQAQIKYVECNGRWGGTSTPMTLLNRVFGDYRKLHYLARDFDDERLKGMDFSRFVELFDDILYHRQRDGGWAIVYNVGCLAPAGKLDIITLADSYEQASHRQDEFRRLVEERL